MEANSLTLMKLFEQNRRLLVPLFQRPYVWKQEEQWEPLWEDVRVLAERVQDSLEVRPHFIGAIVLELTPNFATGQIEERQVIDGQQRLTTLQLMLASVRDLCASRGFTKLKEALDQLTRNSDAMITSEEHRFKVWPTNVDRDDFKFVIRAGSSKAVRERYELKPAEFSGRNIPDAYLYFGDAIKEWVDEDAQHMEQRFTSLLHAVRQHLHLVVIDLGQSDDAQVIFETLNSRGTPLLPADLVKSFLLHLADRANENAEALYEQYWKAFDDASGFWREEMAQGRFKRPRIDLFLQNYLTLKTKDEVPVNHIYGVFRAFAKRNQDSAETHLSELTTYANLYKSFETPSDPSEARFFYRLTQMELGTPVPFLMELYRRVGGKPDRDVRLRVLSILESFLVRRLVCRLTTKGYNKLFLELLGCLDGPPAAVQESTKTFLLSQNAESTRWPDDEEFREAWLDSPLYRVLVRRRLRMLLEALEEKRRTPMAEKVDWREKLTVEHIMPQHWRDHWPLEDDSKKDERNRLIHTAGNLTLVNGKLNPSVSNGSWEKKLKGLKKHSVLFLNKDIVEREEWDEDAIRKRGLDLFKAANTIWPRG